MPRFIKFYDANRVKKSYPLYRRKPLETSITNSNAAGSQVEVAKIQFNNESSKTYQFLETYTVIPVCVITPEESDVNENVNVNVFITSLTTTSITIESSSDFTGLVNLQVFENE